MFIKKGRSSCSVFLFEGKSVYKRFQLSLAWKEKECSRVTLHLSAEYWCLREWGLTARNFFISIHCSIWPQKWPWEQKLVFSNWLANEYLCIASVESVLDIILRLLNTPIHCRGYLRAHQQCWMTQSHVINAAVINTEAFRQLSVRLDPVCDVFQRLNFLFLAASVSTEDSLICDNVILCLPSPPYRKMLFSSPFFNQYIFNHNYGSYLIKRFRSW